LIVDLISTRPRPPCWRGRGRELDVERAGAGVRCGEGGGWGGDDY